MPDTDDDSDVVPPTPANSPYRSPVLSPVKKEARAETSALAGGHLRSISTQTATTGESSFSYVNTWLYRNSEVTNAYFEHVYIYIVKPIH